MSWPFDGKPRDARLAVQEIPPKPSLWQNIIARVTLVCIIIGAVFGCARNIDLW